MEIPIQDSILDNTVKELKSQAASLAQGRIVIKDLLVYADSVIEWRKKLIQGDWLGDVARTVSAMKTSAAVLEAGVDDGRKHCNTIKGPEEPEGPLYQETDDRRRALCFDLLSFANEHAKAVERCLALLYAAEPMPPHDVFETEFWTIAGCIGMMRDRLEFFRSQYEFYWREAELRNKDWNTYYWGMEGVEGKHSFRPNTGEMKARVDEFTQFMASKNSSLAGAIKHYFLEYSTHD